MFLSKKIFIALIIILCYSSLIANIGSEQEEMEDKHVSLLEKYFTISFGYGIGKSDIDLVSYDIDYLSSSDNSSTTKQINNVNVHNFSLSRGFNGNISCVIYPTQHIGFQFGLGFSKMGEITIERNTRNYDNGRLENFNKYKETMSTRYIPLKAGIQIKANTSVISPYANMLFYYNHINSFTTLSSFSDSLFSASTNTTYDINSGLGFECSLGGKYAINRQTGIDLSFSIINASSKVNSITTKTFYSDGSTSDHKTIFTGTETGTHSTTLDSSTSYEEGNMYLSYNAFVINLGIYFIF